jgi:excisionase family DNA binding protein
MRSGTDSPPLDPALLKPFSKKQLAQWLGCSERFIETEVNSGRLRRVLLGTNRVRFLPKHVNEWLEASAAKAGRRKK